MHGFSPLDPRLIPPMLKFALTLGLSLLTTPLLAADTLSVAAAKDNTLWDDPLGGLSSGVGTSVFVGTNGGGQPRRAVVAFDVAGAIPAGSTINSVSLVMNVAQVPGGATANPVGLHRLSADWGEGTSAAGGGAGATSTPGDATWIHTFFNTGFWTTPGGDFAPGASASIPITATGTATWTSAQLAADVQDMLDNPAADFGWLLMADESQVGNARRLDSRESASGQPMLVVDFTPAAAVPTLPAPLFAAFGALLLGAGLVTLRRRGALSA